MSVLSQGTHVYFSNPLASGGPEVVRVECATTFDAGGNPKDQIEDTCLEDSSRSYRPGLRTPGTASIGLNSDPENDSHIALYDLFSDPSNPEVQWAVGWSDGTDAPTLDSNGDFDLPDTRTWFVFRGYVSDFPFSFAQNTVVTSEVSVQKSGDGQWIKKVTP